jgi:hypothetical protein
LLKVTVVKIGQGKAVPLQAWSGPEGSRKLRFPDNVKGKAVPLQVWSGTEGSRKLRFPDNGKVKQSRYRPGVAQRVQGS